MASALGIMPGEWDWMNGSGKAPSPGALAQLGGVLQSLGAQDTSLRNNRHMMKVFAANPEFAKSLYGAQNDLAQLDSENRRLAILEREEQRQLQAQEALRNLAGKIRNRSVVPQDGTYGPVQPQGIDPETALLELAATTGDAGALAKYLQKKATGFDADLPSAIQEYQYWNNLSPAEKQEYLKVKRSNQVINLGGTQEVVGPSGETIESKTVTLKPEDVPANAAAKAGAVAQSQESMKLKVEKEANYPKIAARVDENINIINEALNHPGFDGNFGKLGILPNIPGNAAADAATYIEQIKGTAFLTAIAELKGSGSITEKEGDAATAAVARLQKAQSAESARKALNDLKKILEGAKTRGAAGTSFEGIDEIPEGKIQVNLKTGARRIRKGGQWQPL